MKKSANRKFVELLVVSCLFFLNTTGVQAAMTSKSEVVSKSEANISYQLDVDFDFPARMIKGSAVIDFPRQTAAVVYFDGLTVTDMELNGRQLANQMAKADLVIAPMQEEQKLTIHYRKTVSVMSANFISREGITLNDAWYPQVDKKCLFHLQAAIPADFSAVSEAYTVSRPLAVLHFIAGPYVVSQTSFGDGKTLYAYFFKEDAGLAPSYLKKGLGYLERYEKLIGPYPYKCFSIVENRLPTGYAMPTFTMLGQAVARLPFIVDTSLGHEILHSWFGNAIGVDYSQGNWCEGLTTYLADQSFAADQGKGAEFRKGELVKFASYVHDDLGGAIRDFMGSDIKPDPKHLAERAVGYGKTSMLFHMLRRKIGDDKFFAGLRLFYQQMNGRDAGWRDIEASFKAVGAKDLDGFFKQWLERKDVPNIRAEKFRLDEVDGQLVLQFTLVQANDKPYALDVPIVVKLNYFDLKQTIRMTGKEETVKIPLKDYPQALIIDPQYDLMRKLSTDEMPPVWEWFAGAAKKLAVVNSSAEYDIYAPYIKELKAGGAKIIAADEVKDEGLAAGAVVFLGTSGSVARGLFADPQYPKGGFTVDVRRNPLNPEAPAVLMQAANQEELEAGLAKLRHYGKYSYLHFEKGHATAKRIIEGEMGMEYGLLDEPLGMKVSQAIDFDRIINRIVGKRVIYTGESHTRYADHKLELRVIRELSNRGVDLAIGMEMFPHEAQPALDAFVAGKIDQGEFLRQSKYFKVWGFDYRLYREILNFARRNKIPVIGLNVSKDKVSKVYKEGGISALAPEEKMDLPVDRNLDVPGYRDRIAEVFKMHAGHGGPGNMNGFLQAQAIWDEAMAKSVADYLKDNPQKSMVVIAGKGHVLKNQAIPPRVKRRIDVQQAVIINSDGHSIYPPEVDYVIFAPEVILPPKVLMGIVMTNGKEGEPVKIEEVSPGSPAAKAGIKKGDILLSLDDTPVKDAADVKIVMLGKKRGEKLKAVINRPHVVFSAEKLTLELQL